MFLYMQMNLHIWSLFNEVPENRKCAQVMLYEYLQKPRGVAMLHYPLGKGHGQLSAMDYTILNKQTIAFWRNLCKAMAIRFDASRTGSAVQKRKHDLLLDGPVNN